VFLMCFSASAALAGEAADTPDAAGGGRRLPFYASVLPADTVAVVSASDLEGIAKGARTSSFGRLIFSDAALAAAVEGRLRRAKTILSVITALPGARRDALLTGGCALALLAAPADAPGKTRIPFLILLDLSGLNAESRNALEGSLLAALRLALGDKADFADEAVAADDAPGTGRGRIIGRVHEIKLGEQPDQRFAIGFFDGPPADENGDATGATLIAGGKADVMAAFGNVKDDGPNQLADNPWFCRIIKELKPGVGLAGYVNVDELVQQLDLRRPEARRADVLARLGVGNVPALGFHTRFEPGPAPAEEAGRVVDTLFVSLRRPRVSWVEFLPTRQADLGSARFVPKDFDLYVSAYLGNGDNVWDGIRSTLGDVGGAAALEWFDNWAGSLEMPLGISIKDDIFRSIGGEMFFAIDLDNLSESIADGGIEAEKTPYIFGFRTAQADVLAGALDRVLESEMMWNHMGFDKEHYKVGEYELTKLSSFVEPRYTQGYAFVDGYFLFSPQHAAVEQAVEAYRGDGSLAADRAYAALRATTPGKTNVEAFLRTSVFCRELLDAYAPWLEEPLRPAAQTLLAKADELSDSVVSITMRDDGILAVASSPMGAGAAVVSARKLKDASLRRKLAFAREGLDKAAAAIDRYYAVHHKFPRSLDALVPEFLPDVPDDPFAAFTWLRLLLPVRYRCRQPNTAGERVLRAGGYVLASNGPNGLADFDVKIFAPASWSKTFESNAAADVAAMKAQVYQFRKELYDDERRLDDEGDIVIVHIVKPENGGAR